MAFSELSTQATLSDTPVEWSARYQAVRRFTEQLCGGLATEEYESDQQAGAAQTKQLSQPSSASE